MEVNSSKKVSSLFCSWRNGETSETQVCTREAVAMVMLAAASGQSRYLIYESVE